MESITGQLLGRGTAFLQDTYDFVCLESIGQSHEGSEMVVAKVCRGGCGDKPAMWIGEL